MDSPHAVALVGHSYARRLRTSIFPDHGTYRTDILPPQHWQLERARHLAQALRVSNLYQHVFTLSEGINLISHLPHTTTYLKAIGPSVLVLIVGSNDLANLRGIDHKSARRLAQETIKFAVQAPSKRVILNAVLPRTGNISCSAPDFRENMHTFNTTVKEACSLPGSKLRYNRVQGFAFSNDQHNISRPRPVHEWSGDGIHCEPEAQEMYIERLRRSLLDVMHDVSNT